MKNKQISLRFTEEEYNELYKAAAANGFSITKLIKSSILTRLGSQGNDLTINDVDAAAEKLTKDTQFTIRQLFDQKVWNNFTKSSRLSVGHAFFESVSAGKFNYKYKFDHKNSDNSTVYKRI